MPDIIKPDYSTGLWASGGAIVQPSTAKIQNGWTAEVPPYQWENWSQNRQDQAIAHVLQHGIAVWDSKTEYQAGRSYVQGSDGFLYKARTTHTNVNPTADVNSINWTRTSTGGLLRVIVFTSSTTYVPTPGTRFIEVEAVGGGGSGGACSATGPATSAAGAGGGSGAYARGLFFSGFETNLAVVIGNGGAAPLPAANGSPGGATSLGSLMSCPGGTGGGSSTAQQNPMLTAANGGNSAFPTFGAGFAGAQIVATSGQAGDNGVIVSSTQPLAGKGGSNPLGTGGHAPTNSGGAARSGQGYGGGSSGVNSGINIPAASGLAGSNGIMIIKEYL